MKDVLIIANPSSGKKMAEDYALKAKEVFEKTNRQAEIKITTCKEDIGEFARAACRQKYDTVVVLGGDGTVSELGDSIKEEPYRPKIGIIPSGTINNIARGLGIATNMNQAVEDLANCIERNADAGVVNNRLFLSSVSAGSVPETVWEVEDEQKERYGSLAYFVEGLKSLRDEETYSVRMNMDGEEKEFDLSLMLIGLSNYVAGIPNFFNDAQYDDGKLYLFGLKKATFGEKISVLTSLLSEDESIHNEDNTGFICTFKEVLIESDHISNVALDGEKGPSFPLSIKILPSFFTFLVPKQ